MTQCTVKSADPSPINMYENFMLQGLKSAKELGPVSLVTAGAIAGSAFWAFVYPADAVKSRIQIDDFKNPRYKGTIQCFQTVR